eukprot:2351988-Pyramimonas_sp.AAC.1
MRALGEFGNPLTIGRRASVKELAHVREGAFEDQGFLCVAAIGPHVRLDCIRPDVLEQSVGDGQGPEQAAYRLFDDNVHA